MAVRKLAATSFVLLTLTGCIGQTADPMLNPSAALADYKQGSFQEYLDQTRNWLERNRVFITEQHQQELELVMPFELKPDTPPKGGVLLVHGLGDSPFSYVDIANDLVAQGYLVRTVLLPGHGSKPADLMLPDYEDWQSIVSHHTQLLADEVGEVWLGGYSTGANLVTHEALGNDDVAGLLLFSPAFKPRSDTVRFASIASWFVDWADIDEETNMTRYDSLPMNGAAVYYQTSEVVREALQNKQYTKPVFMAVSEGDSVIDTDKVSAIFSQNFTHPNSQLVWYGDNPPTGERVASFTMNLPQQRISTGSHMGLLFSPDNVLYGTEGSLRVCNNGQTEEQTQDCLQGAKTWFSGWGYTEAGKNHARLTWNPYYQTSIKMMHQVMNQG
ncbi:esterase [Photobacterium proteolyticum]|uniref:Esterase n=1 Tax=Photobacterium proteolyticum TaxID=1903952 RepID=A0A1Q9GFF9_9GAMM|nr:alpha/beta hydrolase [Photobacterium proteolyticum]OLQ73176.1 esterase [Photobacterium proteolyticum]